MRKPLALGAVVGVGVIALERLLRSERGGARRRLGAIRRQIMARMLEGMPPDSPPKLVMSILPRLQATKRRDHLAVARAERTASTSPAPASHSPER